MYHETLEDFEGFIGAPEGQTRKGRHNVYTRFLVPTVTRLM